MRLFAIQVCADLGWLNFYHGMAFGGTLFPAVAELCVTFARPGQTARWRLATAGGALVELVFGFCLSNAVGAMRRLPTVHPGSLPRWHGRSSG